MNDEGAVDILREGLDWQTDQLERIANALERLANHFSPKQAVAAKFLIGGKVVSTQAFPLTDIQQVPYSVPGLDEDSNPTSNVPAGAVAVITSSDPTIVAVVPDPAPSAGNIASGQLVAQPKLGKATISGQVNDASGNLLFKIAGLPQDIQVGASAATSAGFALGTPANQPGK